MIIEYEGEQYQFVFDDISVKQALKIEKHTGVKLTDWAKEIAKEGSINMTAYQALGWLVLSGDGAVEDVDFKILKFAEAVGAAAEKEVAESASGPVPTGAVPGSNGQTPDPAAALAATTTSSATA